MKICVIMVLACCFAAVSGVAAAGVIQAPTDAVINSGSGPIFNTFNQSGLSSGYTSGVTNFDTYIGTGPTHTTLGSAEWASDIGTTAAVVTYDMGFIVNIAGLALWNEDSTGIGLLNLFSSIDGTVFTPLALALAPTDNPIMAGDTPGVYSADVFPFGPTPARFVRFDMSNCLHERPSSLPTSTCAMGEVAFDVVGVPPTGVSEPAALALLGVALAALGITRRRRKA